MKSYISRKISTGNPHDGPDGQLAIQCEISPPLFSIFAYRRTHTVSTLCTLAQPERRSYMNKSPELQQLTGQVEGIMSKVAQDSSPQIEELRTRVADTIQIAKSSIAKADGAAMDMLRNAANSADDYVRDNPWVAIGVIAGRRGIAGVSSWISRRSAKVLHGNAASIACHSLKTNQGSIHGYRVADHHLVAAVRRRRRPLLGVWRGMGHRPRLVSSSPSLWLPFC